MRLHVKKWGNSAAVRIPASVIAAASMHIDQAVEVREEAGRIVIEPIIVPVYTLTSLLDQMDPKTFPDEVDFGPVVGKEIW
jgi:antitoxin MazE